MVTLNYVNITQDLAKIKYSGNIEGFKNNEIVAIPETDIFIKEERNNVQ